MLSGWLQFKRVRHRVPAGLVLLALAGCASSATLRPASGATIAPVQPQPLAVMHVRLPDASHDLLAQLLAGDMALGVADLPAAAADYGKAMRLSTDPRIAAQATGLALAVRDAAGAQAAIARWQALGAKPTELDLARAELALSRGDAAEAQRQLGRLLDSGRNQAWSAFGRVLLAAPDRGMAGRLLEALATPTRLPPGQPTVWLAMSELGQHLGRDDYARRIAEAARQRFHSADADAWAAQLASNQGDPARARSLFRAALAKAPDNLHIKLAYAAMLARGNDFAAALRVLQAGAQDNDSYAMQAALAAHLGDRAVLARLYQQLRQGPATTRADNAFLLGQLAESLGRPDEALDWYAQADDEHEFEAAFRTAVILSGQGHYDEAHQQLAQTETDYLDEPVKLQRAYALDGEIYMQQQDYADAVGALDHALAIRPDDPALLYTRGLARAELGRIDGAVADFRRVLALEPGNVEAGNALGFTLADADRDLPEAQRLLAAARAARPNDPAIADSWGWLQYRLGHLDQAAQVLAGAWRANQDADVGVHLGEVLWKLGHRQDAEHVFDQVRRRDPGNASLRATLKRLGT